MLLGDHYQLPPTSIKGNDAVLTISPFQRLAGHASHVIQLDDPLTPSHVPLISPNLLQYQYRMHPDIAHFPSMVMVDFACQSLTTLCSISIKGKSSMRCRAVIDRYQRDFPGPSVVRNNTP